MEFSHFSICREVLGNLQPSPDLMRVMPRGCSPTHTLHPTGQHKAASPAAGPGHIQCVFTSCQAVCRLRFSIYWLCAIHLNNSWQYTARYGEQVAQGPVRKCLCPWVMEKAAWTQATPCLGTTLCCSEHAFESIFPLQWRVRFFQEGPLNDSCHVLWDLLVISGSFLRLTLIYSSPFSFHLPRPSKRF